MSLLSSTFCWQQLFNISWICSTKLTCETRCSWGSRAQRDVTSVPSPNPEYDLMLMWNVGWGAGGEWEDYHSISPKPVFFCSCWHLQEACWDLSQPLAHFRKAPKDVKRSWKVKQKKKEKEINQWPDISVRQSINLRQSIKMRFSQ